ncbi:MAG: hypothetical protein ACXWWC_10005 [Chitinophagaceae bacterium]
MKLKQQHFNVRSLNLLLSTLSIIACNSSDSNITTEKENTIPALHQTLFDKLAGTWQSEDGKSFERWTKNDNGTYQSVGFSIKGKDTSWNEQAIIYRENDNWIFENTVNGQNDGKAVKFTSTILNENNVQFSNPAHDFPTNINYTVADVNTVNAFITGPNNKGGKDTIHFNFTRVN